MQSTFTKSDRAETVRGDILDFEYIYTHILQWNFISHIPHSKFVNQIDNSFFVNTVLFQ